MMAADDRLTTQFQDADETEASPRRGSRLIGRILPVAVKLWLQTQVEHIEDLAFTLDGTDRQILSGYVPGVSVSAQRAIYQGVHVSQVQLAAQDVKFNLGQVLRGKPLRLLKAFAMDGQVQLSESDLNTSLNAAYLAEGVVNFWRTLFALPAVTTEIAQYYDQPIAQLDWSSCQSAARIEPDYLTLHLAYGIGSKAPAVTLRSQLQILQNRFLILHQPCWLKGLTATDGYFSQALAGFQWDLGSEACLQDLNLGEGYLTCAGQVTVNP